MNDSKKSKLIENLYGICFIVFLAAVFVALLGKNFGSAIWLAIAASNSLSLMVWANLRRKYEIIDKKLANTKGQVT